LGPSAVVVQETDPETGAPRNALAAAQMLQSGGSIDILVHSTQGLKVTEKT
jgi:hypothetical protein